MHASDLADTCMIARGPRIRAVGWLDAKHAFARGPLDERVAAVLEMLAQDGWMHVHCMGFHTCELCDQWRDHRNLLVPGPDVLYVAPGMIAHYMRAHEYLPPTSFCTAVLACPDPETEEYFAELERFRADILPDEPPSEGVFDSVGSRHRTSVRAMRAKRAERAAAEAKRKPFTWD